MIGDDKKVYKGGDVITLPNGTLTTAYHEMKKQTITKEEVKQETIEEPPVITTSNKEGD